MEENCTEACKRLDVNSLGKDSINLLKQRWIVYKLAEIMSSWISRSDERFLFDSLNSWMYFFAFLFEIASDLSNLTFLSEFASENFVMLGSKKGKFCNFVYTFK